MHACPGHLFRWQLQQIQPQIPIPDPSSTSSWSSSQPELGCDNRCGAASKKSWSRAYVELKMSFSGLNVRLRLKYGASAMLMKVSLRITLLVASSSRPSFVSEAFKVRLRLELGRAPHGVKDSLCQD